MNDKEELISIKGQKVSLKNLIKEYRESSSVNKQDRIMTAADLLNMLDMTDRDYPCLREYCQKIFFADNADLLTSDNLGDLEKLVKDETDKSSVEKIKSLLIRLYNSGLK
jgi:hypothetical protein